MNTIVIDYHAHLYPCYDINTALEGAISRLSSHTRGSELTTLAIGLCERFDCDFFNQLESNPSSIIPQWNIESLVPKRVIRLSSKKHNTPLLLFAGRQIVTAERLELLCLGVDAKISEKIPFRDAVSEVKDAGGIPVMNWALGKWMFSRKPIVQQLLDEYSPQELLIGDTSLRPRTTITPSIMKKALNSGFKLIAGSDPLPMPEETSLLGSYGLRVEVDDIDNYSSLLEQTINSSQRQVVGTRSSLTEVAIRNFRLKTLGQ